MNFVHKLGQFLTFQQVETDFIVLKLFFGAMSSQEQIKEKHLNSIHANLSVKEWKKLH